MFAAIKPGWSKPATILFASELPVNEKAFAVALAEAAKFGSDLIIFHAYDSSDADAPRGAGISCCDYARARAEKQYFEPLAQRASNLGLHCKIVVRPGVAAEQILSYLREQKIDQVIMGAHAPGPIGKLLVSATTEAVLRNASVPVNVVGPEVAENSYRNCAIYTILCSVDAHESSRVVAEFAAELAAQYNAHLILQYVLPPQECDEVLAGRTIGEIAAELPSLVPPRLRNKINLRIRAVVGDRTEELLYQSRSQRANLIVLGAHGASRFAAITRAGVVYKVLAYAHCPVITLSPVVLAECGVGTIEAQLRPFEACLAGVF
jgi:nucleotide-binding universal stress UspA family protein